MTLPASNIRRRCFQGVLVLSIAGTSLAVIHSVLQVDRQVRSLATPTLHDEVWRVYQVQNAAHRLLGSADQILQGKGSAEQLNLHVVELAEKIAAFATSTETPGLIGGDEKIRQSVDDLSRLSSGWAAVKPQASGRLAEQTARDVVLQLPGFLVPLNDLVSSAIILRANKKDADREVLFHEFKVLSSLLALLLLASAWLLHRLIANYRKAGFLARRLRELNQSLETQVEVRTHEISRTRDLLTFILDASPSNVVLLGGDAQEVHFVSQRLLRELGLSDKHEFALERIFSHSTDAETFRLAVKTSRQMDGWEVRVAAQPPYWSSMCWRQFEYQQQPALLIWSYDISARKRMEQELLAQAATDVLTGLSNRREFMRKAAECLAVSQRFGRPGALLMLDIDHFKEVNDRYGHPVGDRALQVIAEVIRHALRGMDILGRLGGEEFAVLLLEADYERGLHVAERLRWHVETSRIPLDGAAELRLTISIGFVCIEPDDSLEDLLLRADSALYKAKAKGRNRVEEFVVSGA